jgi:hypothetical protein
VVRINKKLNLVIPLKQDSGIIYVHAMPLMREAYEQHFEVIAGTFARIYKQGLSIISGPRIAALMLRRVAEGLGQLETVEKGLLLEMRRLANVVMLTDRGWETITLDAAVTRGLLDEDDLAEVEGLLAFFMCASAIHRKAEIQSVLTGLGAVWRTQTTLLTVTEWKGSLPTSTETATSPMPATVAASSVPS